MWNAQAGFFVDYLWQEGRQSDTLSAATVFPLYFGVATPEQAHAIAAAVRGRLLSRAVSGRPLLTTASNGTGLTVGRLCSTFQSRA